MGSVLSRTNCGWRWGILRRWEVGTPQSEPDIDFIEQPNEGIDNGRNARLVAKVKTARNNHHWITGEDSRAWGEHQQPHGCLPEGYASSAWVDATILHGRFIRVLWGQLLRLDNDSGRSDSQSPQPADWKPQRPIREVRTTDDGQTESLLNAHGERSRWPCNAGLWGTAGQSPSNWFQPVPTLEIVVRHERTAVLARCDHQLKVGHRDQLQGCTHKTYFQINRTIQRFKPEEKDTLNFKEELQASLMEACLEIKKENEFLR